MCKFLMTFEGNNVQKKMEAEDISFMYCYRLIVIRGKYVHRNVYTKVSY